MKGKRPDGGPAIPAPAHADCRRGFRAPRAWAGAGVPPGDRAGGRRGDSLRGRRAPCIGQVPRPHPGPRHRCGEGDAGGPRARPAPARPLSSRRTARQARTAAWRSPYRRPRSLPAGWPRAGGSVHTYLRQWLSAVRTGLAGGGAGAHLDPLTIFGSGAAAAACWRSSSPGSSYFGAPAAPPPSGTARLGREPLELTGGGAAAAGRGGGAGARLHSYPRLPLHGGGGFSGDHPGHFSLFPWSLSPLAPPPHPLHPQT